MEPASKVGALIKAVVHDSVHQVDEARLVEQARLAAHSKLGLELPACAETTQLVALLRRRNLDQAGCETLIAAVLEKLGDRYSRYLPTHEYLALLKRSASGERRGVGISLGLVDERLAVLESVPNTPAALAGLDEGDRLVSIDGKVTTGMSVGQARQLISESAANSIELCWLEPNGERRQARLTCTAVEVDRLDFQRTTVASRAVGRLKIRSFSKSTGAQLDHALRELGEVDGYVIDLRNNPGGYVTAAVDLCSRFLPANTLVVTARGRNGDKVYRSQGSSPLVGKPVVVLVNQHSASAAEISAAALQDHQVALVIGQTTYGKGTIQNFHRFRDLSTLKLTIAHYLTPSGRSLDHSGVIPDIKASSSQLDALVMSALQAWKAPDPDGQKLSMNGLFKPQ